MEPLYESLAKGVSQAWQSGTEGIESPKITRVSIGTIALVCSGTCSVLISSLHLLFGYRNGTTWAPIQTCLIEPLFLRLIFGNLLPYFRYFSDKLHNILAAQEPTLVALLCKLLGSLMSS